MMTKNLFQLVIVIYIVLFSQVVVGDQGSCKRCLAGHNFIPSVFIADPFIDTFFGTSTGLGYAKYKWQSNDGEGLSAAAIEQRFEFQKGILDLFAINAMVAGNASSGTNAESALKTGLNLGYQFGGGSKVG